VTVADGEMSGGGPDRSVEVAVVGAGLAGLCAARSLVEAGRGVVLLDKARGIGGRMATRRIGTAVCDHGAQYFSVRSRAFGLLVAEAEAAGAVRVWSDRFPETALGGKPATAGRPRARWCGTTGMTALPKLLAGPLDLRQSSRVTAVSPRGQRAELRLESGEVIEAAAVVLTPPVPQSLELLAAGGFSPDGETGELLRGIEYDPCFAVMAVLARASLLPPPGGLALAEGPVAWLADNQLKGISPVPALTIHATPAFSRRHFDDDPAEVAATLLAAVAEWIDGGVSGVVERSVHRWKFSRPTTTTAAPLAVVCREPPALLAGDAFGGPRVEGAAASGLAAGRWLARLLAERG